MQKCTPFSRHARKMRAVARAVARDAARCEDLAPGPAMLQPAHGGAKCANHTCPERISWSTRLSVLLSVMSKHQKSPSSIGHSHASPASLMAPVSRPHPENISIAKRARFLLPLACAMRARVDALGWTCESRRANPGGGRLGGGGGNGTPALAGL